MLCCARTLPFMPKFYTGLLFEIVYTLEIAAHKNDVSHKMVAEKFVKAADN